MNGQKQSNQLGSGSKQACSPSIQQNILQTKAYHMDKEGHFIVIKGTIGNSKKTLLSETCMHQTLCILLHKKFMTGIKDTDQHQPVNNR